jgi:hypothetical protein
MVQRATQLATRRLGALASLASVTLLGCGARTGLSEGDLDGGAETAAGDALPSIDAPDAPKPLCAPAPRPSAPLEIPTFVDDGPFLASSGCSFAATWIGLDGEVPVVEAATFRAPTGEWQSSKLRVARGTPSLTTSSITWDGSAFVIGWVDGALFLQRMAEDGTFLGPATRSFSTSDVLVWLAPGAGGELGLGFVSSDGFQSGNGVADVSYARILSDGTVTLPPTAVTNGAVYGTFSRAGDSNEVLSVAGPALYVESFDDDGVVHQRTQLALLAGSPFSGLTGSYFAYSPSLGDGSYFVLGELGAAARVHIPGDYVPMLAATDLGAVGVLSDAEAGLTLSVLHGTTLDSSATLSTTNLATSNSYAIAGGKESFGALWIIDIDQGSQESLAFTVVTP